MADEEWISVSSPSEVWKHFERKKDANIARCKKCKKTLAAVTTSLRYHAENKHNIVFEKKDKTQPTIQATISAKKVILRV